MNSEWSKHSQSGNDGNKTFTFCQNGKCCSTGSLPTKKEEMYHDWYCRRNKYKANELGECSKFDFEFDSVEGNLTYSSAVDGWNPYEIELFIGNGTQILEGYYNIIKCSFEKRKDLITLVKAFHVIKKQESNNKIKLVLAGAQVVNGNKKIIV